MLRTLRRIGTTQWAHQGYLNRIEKAGGRPLIITPRTLLSEVDECAGLLIPGGRDVDPGWYDDKVHPMTQPPDEARDSLEIALIKRFLKKDIPILGVCRGHQLLNVAMGGSLHQHIHGHEGHKHRVNVFDTELMAEMEDFYVNSLHHQAIKDLAPGLKMIAVADDGTVEAIQSPNHTFVLGLQWHPELDFTPRFDRSMSEMMENFVNARK